MLFFLDSKSEKFQTYPQNFFISNSNYKDIKNLIKCKEKRRKGGERKLRLTDTECRSKERESGESEKMI
ncbi:MAG: hypothetical protein A2Y41_10895 [Spirochaetes bacterium GWB1_36_13]|nr:MAG: hypothetical protein A2Y41_10895 [Spirochaetes bacterium GWB1_36_13]